MPDFMRADGEWCHGKTIGVDLYALYELMEEDETAKDFFRTVFKLGEVEPHD